MKKESFQLKATLWVILTIIFFGCSAHSPYNRKYVSDSIEDRVGSGLPMESPMDTLKFPVGISLEDGLTEEEAVSIALWNNAQFQSVLVELGLARADLIQAGLLRNPIFSMFFPIGPKQLEFTMYLPIEILWQRPSRIAAAKMNCERVAENLVQHGLSLVRDVTVAFADLNLAEERLKIVADEVILRDEIAEIALARLRAGDISELEEIAFHLMASQTRETYIRFDRDAEIAKIRLKTLLGIISQDVNFQLKPSPIRMNPIQDTEQLIKTALAARPDLRAAELEIEAAGKRLGWERSKIFNLTALLDANAEGKEGFEMGPGMQLELPIFNWNNGGVSRAHAEIERAAKRYLGIHHSIRKEIFESYHNYLAAKKVYDILKDDILPAAVKAVENGERAYLVGAISYLEFLEFRRQLLEARLRFVEAEAGVRRGMAHLCYSIGGRVLQK